MYSPERGSLSKTLQGRHVAAACDNRGVHDQRETVAEGDGEGFGDILVEEVLRVPGLWRGYVGELRRTGDQVPTQALEKCRLVRKQVRAEAICRRISRSPAGMCTLKTFEYERGGEKRPNRGRTGESSHRPGLYTRQGCGVSRCLVFQKKPPDPGSSIEGRGLGLHCLDGHRHTVADRRGRCPGEAHCGRGKSVAKATPSRLLLCARQREHPVGLLGQAE